ncbi:hypothetical protein F7725_014587 [Dissostichus mawsoni]|uniref:C2H2-type domain-containing protein n=1 Tax=Dissostichus mawsoni TaxID=36200 RepID=A0A7J5YYP2_DISMA|nr:hypothetical protein F7725_014587 [Dissostichus mawsoni]
MSKLQAVRALLAERLSAAAEQIFSSEDAAGIYFFIFSLSPDMPSEQQRAAVHKRLSMVADEIFRILEDMMGEYEARVTESHQESQSQPPDAMLKTETNVPSSERLTLLGSNTEKDVSSEQSRTSSLVQKTLHLKFKDAYTDTDCDLIHTGLSHNHQAQRAEKGTSTMMETETQSNPKVLSSNNSETPSEDNNSEMNEKHLKSLQSHSQGEDCCQLCGRSFLNGVIGKKIKKHKRNNFTSNKSPTAGQSCCRVCGKFFHYKRSFLKHVVTHKQNSDLCGACGKHLDSDESLEVHLQMHKEENICRDSEEKQSEAEGSDAGNKEDSDESVRTVRIVRRKDTVRRNRSKTDLVYESQKQKELKIRITRMYLIRNTSVKASFLRHVLEDEEDTDVCGLLGKEVMEEDEDGYFSGDQIPVFICELLLRHRLPRNVSGFLSLG